MTGKWPLLSRPQKYHMGAGARSRRKGGALSVTGKWPLLSRPRVYHMGAGANLSRRRPAHRGRGPISAVLGRIPLLGSFLGPIASLFGAGARRRMAGGATRRMPAPHYVRPHMSHTRTGARTHVKGHWAGGAARRAPAPHYVRPHMSHTRAGARTHVKGHWAGGALARGRPPYFSPVPSRGLNILPRHKKRMLLMAAGGRLLMGGRARRGGELAPHLKYYLSGLRKDPDNPAWDELNNKADAYYRNSADYMQKFLTGPRGPTVGSPEYDARLKELEAQRKAGGRHRRGAKIILEARGYIPKGLLVGPMPMAPMGGRMRPRPHFIKAHTSRTRYGHPVHVRGHWAAGGGAIRRVKVAPHVRLTRRGPVKVRGHVKGMGAMRRVAPHIRMTARGPVKVRGHIRGGLLSP